MAPGREVAPPAESRRVATTAEAELSDQPDSVRGWVVVGAAFVALVVAFGVMNSFGSFFGPMADEFGAGRAATATLFSLTTSIMSITGLWSGRLADRRGPRALIALAAVSLGAGLIVTSRVGSLWLGYLTYGFGVGIAVGLVYVPMIAAVSGWFVRRRSLAVGIAIVGSGLGTVVFSPLTSTLVEHHGWRTTYVVMGIGTSGLLGLSALVTFRPPTSTTALRVPAMSIRALARNDSFRQLYLMMFLMTLCLFVPLVFLRPYADSIGLSSGHGAALVSILGAGSILGRIGLGALGSRGPVRLFELSAWTLVGCFPLWFVAGDRYGVLVACAFAAGVGLGGFTALSPAVAVECFGPRALGGLLGALYTSAGLGGLLGPWLAGSIADAGSYRHAIVVAAALGGAGALVLGRLRRRLDAAGREPPITTPVTSPATSPGTPPPSTPGGTST